MQFSYKAKKVSGETYQGEREANDKFALFRDLRKEGETVLSCNEMKKGVLSGVLHVPAFFGGVNMHEKIIFARNLGGMISAGLALSRALQVMERQTKKKKLKHIFSELNRFISEGKSFHEALAKFPDVFGSLFVSMSKAGEESGNLASSLKQIADQLEKTYLIQKKVKGAMVYPGVIISLMIVIGILMLTFVVPRLVETFAELGSELPTSTKFVIWLSGIFQHHYILAFLAIVGSVTAFYYSLRTPFGKKAFDYCVLRLPVVGLIIKETNSARTARTLSSLLSSGVDLVLAISITGEVLQNSYYKKVLEQAALRVEKGLPLSGVFLENERLYPIFVGEMASVGEETGELGHMLSGVADFYEQEVEQKTKDMSTIIEPVLMIVIGIGVGFFAISMISPMYSVMNDL